MVEVDENLVNWVRLIRSQNVGPVTFWQMLKHYGTVEAALDAIPQLSKRGGRTITACNKDDALREIEAHHKAGINLLPSYSPDYPDILKKISDYPPVLSVRGKLTALGQKMIGIVGARNASLHGRRFAHQLATELGKAGWGIASGLARGIDGAAHEGAVATGTVAVVAGGVDVLYPPEHKKLYDRICEEGAVVSEMPLGLYPGATHFPRRNRIISGLSQGVIVVEAAQRSGSLITARFAAEQNRDLFAVPGSPVDPRCKGTNDLIRQGATIVESSADILANLGTATIKQYMAEGLEEEETSFQPKPVKPENLEGLRSEILTLLSTSQINIDDLTRQVKQPVQNVLTALLELELSGQVMRHPNNSVSLVL